jgi:citrate synthase
MKTRWVTAEEALARLKTKSQTLYANVSRGRIQARPDPGDPRRSLYRLEDVQRMAERQKGRRQSSVLAAETIRWGEPVLPTSISGIENGRLFYRGTDACVLADDKRLEDIAAILWELGETNVKVAAGAYSGGTRMGAAFAVLAARAPIDLPTLGRTSAILRLEAAEVLASVASALAPSPHASPLHERLAASWKQPNAATAIRSALVLSAEHELNVSAFAARVTASSGAALSATVLSGLTALIGPRHGGAWISVSRLIERAATSSARDAIREMLASEGVVRAFGHRLYPKGDPRAKAIMASFEAPDVYGELAQAGEELLGEPINIDFALSALAAAFKLPDEAPLTIFALARTVGWLAHALEQVESGQLIRPRAHYTGTFHT